MQDVSKLHSSSPPLDLKAHPIFEAGWQEANCSVHENTHAHNQVDKNQHVSSALLSDISCICSIKPPTSNGGLTCVCLFVIIVDDAFLLKRIGCSNITHPGI